MNNNQDNNTPQVNPNNNVGNQPQDNNLVPTNNQNIEQNISVQPVIPNNNVGNQPQDNNLVPTNNQNIEQNISTQPVIPNNNVGNQPPNNNANAQNQKKKNSIVPLIICILLIVVVFHISHSNNSSTRFSINKNRNTDYDRLIMIYMVGSNLESGQIGGGTLDLNGINYTSTESNNTKVIVISGGAKSWHNDYIDPNSTSIYELTANGYQIVNKQSLRNMGNAKVLSDFLNYGYNNYAAKKYDLIFWNHGLGVLGYGTDELSNDYLQLNEMNSALNNSVFKDNNKLELIIFRTCLNGTLEVADTLKKYADYFVASQETTWMYTGDNVLKLLNNINSTDNGNEFGIKYVDGYMNYINRLNSQGTYTYNTYSVIDLSKIDKVETALADFVKDIDLTANYIPIAKSRSVMHQYGSQSDPTFDSIDLYNLVTNLKTYSPNKAQALLDALSEAIIYNKADDSQSKGLSIYFPYNGEQSYKETIIRRFYNFEGLKEYKTFIKNFNDVQKSNNNAIGLSANAIDYIRSSSIKEADFVFKLTDDEAKKLDKTNCTIYEKHNETEYLPVYFSKDVHFSDNTLEFNIKNRQLTVVDELNDNKTLALYKFHKDDMTQLDLDYVNKQQITLIETKETDDYILYYTLAFLTNDNIQDPNLTKINNTDTMLYLKLDKKTNNTSIEKVLIGGKTSESKDNITTYEYNTIVNLEDYKYIIFSLPISNLSNLEDNVDIKLNIDSVLQVETSKLKFKLEDYTSNKEYYALFKLHDIYGNYSYSKLIKLN